MKVFISCAWCFFLALPTMAQHDMKNMPGMKMEGQGTDSLPTKKTSEKNKAKDSKTKMIYTCSMHPQVQKDKPGKCPICGMTLIKKTITKAPDRSSVQKVSETNNNVMPDVPAKNKNGSTTDMGNMKMETAVNNKPNPAAVMKMPDDGNMKEEMKMDNMNSAFSLHLPMARNGSGTGWLPDASPMYGYMFHKGKWMYMAHGNLFLRYTKQDIANKGSRGNQKYDAPNWLMFMGQRKVGEKGLLHFSTMFSLDPVTEGGQGYPLLFQSGEAYNGRPIVDRQHPHDLFSELSISYSHAFSKKTDAFIYIGYPGEPALGPVAFMHRPAALYNPDAPLSHHWSDATHITFGVATAGIRLGNFKIDASSFSGREPDDYRYDFDKPRFDSWSGRVSFNPSETWALQVSHGFIKSPEALHPTEDVNRTTASAIYSKAMNGGGWVNASLVYGVNNTKGHKDENSILLEGSWNRKRLALYSRYEFVQKSVEELALDETIYGHDNLYAVNEITAGVHYDVIQLANTRLAMGTQFSYYAADKKLDGLYGSDPMAFQFYLRIYPAVMKVHTM